MRQLERELRQLMAEGKVAVAGGITDEGVAVIRFQDGSEMPLPGVQWGPYLESEREIAAAATFARLMVVAGLSDNGEALDAVRNIPFDWVGDVFPNPLRTLK